MGRNNEGSVSMDELRKIIKDRMKADEITMGQLAAELHYVKGHVRRMLNGQESVNTFLARWAGYTPVKKDENGNRTYIRISGGE